MLKHLLVGAVGLSSLALADGRPHHAGRDERPMPPVVTVPVVLSAPVRPVFEYAHSNVARSDATTRSQAIAIPSPPAAATPSTAAMNGFDARRTSEIALWMYSRICLKTSPY